MDGGRIQRTDQGGDTVGEGQAYGLLAAAAVGDEQRFDRIWSWTEHNMLDSDGLLALNWEGGRVVDSQPAADADLDAARALLVDACRFNRPDLRSAAIRIGDAVLARETAKAGSIYVLLAGHWANMGSHLVLNPSYVDPTTLDPLATASGNSRFRDVAAGGRQLVNELTRPLPPDWAIVDAANRAGESGVGRRLDVGAGRVHLRRAAHARAVRSRPRSGRAKRCGACVGRLQAPSRGTSSPSISSAELRSVRGTTPSPSSRRPVPPRPAATPAPYRGSWPRHSGSPPSIRPTAAQRGWRSDGCS